MNSVKIVGMESTAFVTPGTETMTLLSQFGGKIYNINYHGTPEAYNTFLPTAQQIIDFFTVTEMYAH